MAIVLGAIVAYVIAFVYYGFIFTEVWLHVRRLNLTSMGGVSTSPAQPLIELWEAKRHAP